MLVGRPGIGKGAALNPAINLLKESKTANILSDRVTMEFAMEKLSNGFPIMGGTNGKVKIGSEATAVIVSTELSVFITASQFSITALSDLWDSKEGIYQYGTRGKGEFNINNPYVSLMGASAQDWLIKSIPADAVGGGFTRRVNFVFASKKDKKVAWPMHNGADTVPKLVNDLQHIGHNIGGEFKFSLAAQKIFEPYYLSCEPSEFDDEATAVYKSSKWANAAKVAMCLSVAKSDSLIIEACDFQQAIDMVEDVAADLKVVFRAVGESPLVTAQDKVIRFIESKGMATKQEILSTNWRHMTSDDLDRILATLCTAGYLIEKQIGKKTMYFVTTNQVPVVPVTP